MILKNQLAGLLIMEAVGAMAITLVVGANVKLYVLARKIDGHRITLYQDNLMRQALLFLAMPVRFALYLKTVGLAKVTLSDSILTLRRVNAKNFIMEAVLAMKIG